MKIEVQSFVFSSLFLMQNLTKLLLAYHFIIATPTLRKSSWQGLLECSQWWPDNPFPHPYLRVYSFYPHLRFSFFILDLRKTVCCVFRSHRVFRAFYIPFVSYRKAQSQRKEKIKSKVQVNEKENRSNRALGMGDWKKLYSTIFRRERVEKRLGVFSIQPNIPEISVENQMVSTLSVWSDRPEYLRAPMKMVYFDRSFRSDRNFSFHLPNCCPQ